MLNRVILMGRLVANPELKTTNGGTSVTSFRIAVDRSYVKAGAERQTDFFDIVAWRSSAEFVCRNFAKGSLIALDGQLQTRQYTTKDGQNRTVVEVVADNISFTGERRDAGNAPVSNDMPQGGNYAPYPQTPNTAQNPAPYQYQTAQNPPQYAQGYQQPQYAQGAAYDPRSDQGQIQPPPQGAWTPDGDLPF